MVVGWHLHGDWLARCVRLRRVLHRWLARPVRLRRVLHWWLARLSCHGELHPRKVLHRWLTRLSCHRELHPRLICLSVLHLLPEEIAIRPSAIQSTSNATCATAYGQQRQNTAAGIELTIVVLLRQPFFSNRF